MILDHIDRLELADEEADDHFDAVMALARLGEGLFWIHGEVSRIETGARAMAAREGVRHVVVGGLLDDLPMGLLSCAFQWYAVSACNYAQLVGWLAFRETQKAKDYVKGVATRLVNYRNKVAAHFAMTDPRRTDTEADLLASVMTHIVYAEGHLFAAALAPVVTAGENVITVSRNYSWSLTRTHARLARRYWPQGPPKSHQALRVPPGTTKFSVTWSDLFDDAG
jgi:hypothetical protein